MSVRVRAGEDVRGEPIAGGGGGGAGHPRMPAWLLPALLVAVAASPIVVGAVSLVGDTWYPVGDWASMLFRTAQVGTSDTPLVGAYTVKGWAHPGPFLFWAAAPVYRLTGGDPRSLAWTAGIVNCLVVAAIGVLAWRRGRWPLLVAVTLLTGLLVHGITPGRLVDLWNPYLGLLPFLLAVLLAWDAALGRRRSLVLAAVPASIAVQCHVAFAALCGLVLVWLYVWCRWWPRLVPGAGGGEGAGAGDLPRPPWAPWWLAVRNGLIVAAVLWLPPLVDLVVDTHNLASVAGHLVTGSGTQIGLAHGGSLVSRYVRPDGPWMGGPEPALYMSTQGSGPVPVVLVLALLVGCVAVARRRRLVDAAALGTLTIVLVVGAVPATANLVAPAFGYLTQWLKIVGGLVWLTVGWTAWRVVEPSVRAWASTSTAASSASPTSSASADRRAGPASLRWRALGALGVAAIVGVAAWTWWPASRVEMPAEFESAVVQDLRAQVADELPHDRRYRLSMAGDLVAHNGPGLMYYMLEDGFDVVTRDGSQGLKWGHDGRWSEGEPYDVALTVAVHYGGTFDDHFRECLEDPDVELVAVHQDLSAAERDELTDLRYRSLAEGLEGADAERAAELSRRDFSAGVFAGDVACATPQPGDRERSRSDSDSGSGSGSGSDGGD